jgi:glycosyltransferase involved in cell wall biosynthesis
MTGTAARPPRIAFYAPMKPPDHPNPSGDREIARQLMAALTRAGCAPFVASRLRLREPLGDPAAQRRLLAQAEAEARSLAEALTAEPPAAWFTYHCYYKAPDLIGPQVARALNIPYLISEASVSARRRVGPWAAFAAASDAAIAAADRLFWTTARDRPGLETAGHAARMTHLPAFLPVEPTASHHAARTPLRLLTVAMMRPGDKVESYRRLAAALAALPVDWQLTVIGEGTAAGVVDTLFAPFGERVIRVGAVHAPQALQGYYAEADLLVWPGVNEGVGMVWLEAQAVGLPVVAEHGPAAAEVVSGGLLVPPDQPRAFADAILSAAADRVALSRQAHARMRDRHSLDAAARTLADALDSLAR